MARLATGSTTARTDLCSRRLLGSRRPDTSALSARPAATTTQPTVKAKANFSQAEVIAAVAAEFRKQYEAERQAAETADWRSHTG